jgi:hypothetical protein
VWRLECGSQWGRHRITKKKRPIKKPEVLYYFRTPVITISIGPHDAHKPNLGKKFPSARNAMERSIPFPQCIFRTIPTAMQYFSLNAGGVEERGKTMYANNVYADRARKARTRKIEQAR